MNENLRHLHTVGATGGECRTEMYDGREHLVVPTVPLIGDQVIHAVNAPHAEFVPAAPLALAPHQWNGRPLVLGHPVKDGHQISANDPRVMEHQAFGFMAETHINGKRLGTEAWVDTARLLKAATRQGLDGERMLERMRNGEPIEVSVGAFVTTNDKTGTVGGKNYKGEWVTIAADHLAFLPNGRGACSLEMGCGTGRHASAHLVTAEGYEEIDDERLETLIGNGSNQYGSKGSRADHADAAIAHETAAKAHEDAVRGESINTNRTHDAYTASKEAHAVSKKAGVTKDSQEALTHADLARGATKMGSLKSIEASHREAARYHRQAANEHHAAIVYGRHAEESRSLIGDGSNQYGQKGSGKGEKESAPARRYGVTLHNNDNVGVNADKNTKTVMSTHSSLSEAKRAASYSGERRLVHDLSTHTVVHDTRKSPGQVYNSSSYKGDKSGNLHSSDGTRVGKFQQAESKSEWKSRQPGPSSDEKRKNAEIMFGKGKTMKGLKERILALFDTPEQAASEEAAELIAYQAMRTQLDSAGDQLNAASELIDALIADETENPTATRQQEDAEEEVEDARLDAIRMHCYSMIAALQSVCNACSDQQMPEPMPTTDPRYMEAFKALVGKSISAANMKKVQAAHDSSHDLHTHTVALGASCNGMKLLAKKTEDCTACDGSGNKDGNPCEVCGGSGELKVAESKPCGCGGRSAEGEDMTKEVRAAGIKILLENKDSGWTKEDEPTLLALTDARFEATLAMVEAGLRTAATKAEVEKVIIDKHAADTALQSHAKMLSDKAKDAAQKEKDDAAENKDDKLKAAAEKQEREEARLKAASDAGISLEEYDEREYLKHAPASVRALVENEKARKAARHTELVTTLAAVGALSKDQLKLKTLEDLETLATFAKIETPKADYSGRGGVARFASEADDVRLNPPNPYAPGVEKLRAQMAK
jgi:hypothetical protein